LTNLEAALVYIDEAERCADQILFQLNRRILTGARAHTPKHAYTQINEHAFVQTYMQTSHDTRRHPVTAW